jgi:cell wall-associated NlpC family hydrolase
LSDRADARHRSPHRAATPLSQLTGAVTDQLGGAGRTGAIVAISTGLVAAVALPAQALGRQSTASTSTSTSAAPAAPPVAGARAYSAVTGSHLTVGPGALAVGNAATSASNAALSAPATAVVSFETGAFTAVPKPPPPRPAAAPARSAAATVTSRAAQPAASDDDTSSTATGGSAAHGSSVLAIAARYVGTPYVYGGTTPRGFDCSGYVRYVYGQLGVSLPRTANAQMLATKRISRSEAKPGDLVFFVSGGRAYHDGIYAGNGMIYDAPRSGKTVSKRAIWDATIVFGRV